MLPFSALSKPEPSRSTTLNTDKPAAKPAPTQAGMAMPDFSFSSLIPDFSIPSVDVPAPNVDAIGNSIDTTTSNLVQGIENIEMPKIERTYPGNKGPLRITVPSMRDVKTAGKPSKKLKPQGVSGYVYGAECSAPVLESRFLNRGMFAGLSAPQPAAMPKAVAGETNSRGGKVKALFASFDAKKLPNTAVPPVEVADLPGSVKPPEPKKPEAKTLAAAASPAPETAQVENAKATEPEIATKVYKTTGAIINREEVHIPNDPTIEPPARSLKEHLIAVIPKVTEETIRESQRPMLQLVDNSYASDLSDLEPAAGGDTGALIDLPAIEAADEAEQKKQAREKQEKPKPVTPAEPAPAATEPATEPTTAPAAEPVAPPAAEQVQQEPLSTPPAAESAPAPTQAEPTAPPAATAVEAAPAAQTPAETPPPAPTADAPAAPVELQEPAPAPEAKPEPKPQATKAKPKKPAAKPVEVPELDAPRGTEAEISPESKKILKKIPFSADTQPQPIKEPLKIERATESPPIAREDPKVISAKHEAIGIKIEVKTPKVDVNYEVQKAYQAQSSGDASNAVLMYQTALDADPNNVNALLGLAVIYHRSSQLEKARTLYGRVLSIQPNNKEAMNNFMSLMATESPGEAIAQLERLEERNPSTSGIPAQLAVIYQKQGEPSKAIEKMLRAVEISPENTTYRYNLAIMLDSQKRYEEAANLYIQLLKAADRGENIPGNVQKIQQRLTFIRSNRH